MVTLAALIERRRALPEGLKTTAAVVGSLLLARWWALDFVPRHIGSLWGPYFWGPIGWLACAAVAIRIYRRQEAWRPETERAVEPGAVLTFAAIVGVFIVATQVILGMFANFGHSPFAHSPKWLLINLLFAGSTLLAVEATRAVLLRTLSKRSLLLALLFTSLALVAIQLPDAQFEKHGMQAQAKFWGSAFIPLAATGLVAGFFVLYGGIKAGLLVSGPVVAFQYFSPILPVADWPLMALAGVAGPAIGLWVAEGLFSEDEAEEESKGLKLPSVAWLVTAVLSLAIFWFSFGFFGYRPMFVPSTSMVPVLNRGDVVLLGPVKPDKVKVGDIVLYSLGGRTRVLHRVIDIKKGENGDRQFVFKGDHNNADDGVPVPDKGLLGTYQGHLPKVGWLPIKVQTELSKLR